MLSMRPSGARIPASVRMSSSLTSCTSGILWRDYPERGRIYLLAAERLRLFVLIRHVGIGGGPGRSLRFQIPLGGPQLLALLVADMRILRIELDQRVDQHACGGDGGVPLV